MVNSKTVGMNTGFYKYPNLAYFLSVTLKIEYILYRLSRCFFRWLDRGRGRGGEEGAGAVVGGGGEGGGGEET